MAKGTGTIEERAKKAAKAKAKEAEAVARDTLLTLETEDDGETHDFLTADKDIAGEITEFSGDADANKDIFSDIGEERVKKGDIIKYTIFKYGSQLTSVYHPCSWEMIHKKFGDGQYKVLARSQSLNRIVKTQSRMLGKPPAEFTFGGFEGGDTQETTKETPVQAGNQPPSFMEIFTLLMNQQNQAKAESKEVNMAAQQSQNQMMMMFMEMMKSNQQQAVQSQLQTMQLVTQVTEKISEAQSKMFEKLNERIEKIADAKGKTPDVETLIERMQKAQEQGFALYQKFDELATKKAELQLEMMGGDDDDDDEKPEKESLTDTLIKTIIPMMAAGQRQMPQNFVQRPQRGTLPRRSVPPSAALARPNGVRGQGTRPPQASATGTPNQAQGGGHVETPVTTRGEVSSQGAVVETIAQEVEVKMRGALPEVDVTTVTTPEVYDFSDETDDQLETTEGLVFSPKTGEEKEAIHAKCREILPGFVGGLMLEATPADLGAVKVIGHLLENGIGTAEFVEHVSAQDLIGFAKQFDLPEEAFSWLNELYAHIQATAGTNVGGGLTPGIEPELVEGPSGQP